MTKLKMHTPDLVAANVEKVAALFPGCVTEATDEKTGQVSRKIDFDLLRQELSDFVVDGPGERYHFDWPGKREALLAANSPIAKTLRPARDQSVDFETTRNLFIEGDNLDTLKLLQETYLGQVKLIYIDPPYNTGRDFLYSDKYAQPEEGFLLESGQTDEEGYRLVANTVANGRFHSTWLSMMYSRLKLAKNLLANDGAIFISIDDGEQASLKRMCDEIFGEANFIATVVWRSKDNSNNDAKRFSLDHNYILIYARDPGWQPARLEDESKQGHFKNPDNDPKGAYFDGNPLNSPNYRENLVYSLESPQGHKIPAPKNGWRWSPSVMQEKIASGEIRFTEDGKGIRRRTYLKDQEGLPPSTLWIDLDKTGHNRQAKYELLKLLPEDVFETPKPTKLLKYILRLANTKGSDIVLDFFAGSGTTAEAVLQLNAEDGEKRRFILNQIPEAVDEDSNARKAGFRTIADIGKERLRRVGAAIRGAADSATKAADIGFRVLSVDDSNWQDVKLAPNETSQSDLLALTDNLKGDRSAEDLLFEVLLTLGVDCGYPVQRQQIHGYTVFLVEGNGLVACFDQNIGEDLIKELARLKPLRAVFRDSSYANDSMKINVDQIFKLLSPETDVRTL